MLDAQTSGSQGNSSDAEERCRFRCGMVEVGADEPYPADPLAGLTR